MGSSRESSAQRGWQYAGPRRFSRALGDWMGILSVDYYNKKVMNNFHKSSINKERIHQSNTLFNFSKAEKKVIINLGDPDSFTTRLLHLLIKPGLRLIN